MSHRVTSPDFPLRYRRSEAGGTEAGDTLCAGPSNHDCALTPLIFVNLKRVRATRVYLSLFACNSAQLTGRSATVVNIALFVHREGYL